jgi:hypothetical protein
MTIPVSIENWSGVGYLGDNSCHGERAMKSKEEVKNTREAKPSQSASRTGTPPNIS